MIFVKIFGFSAAIVFCLLWIAGQILEMLDHDDTLPDIEDIEP